jgi:hypothetical protein
MTFTMVPSSIRQLLSDENPLKSWTLLFVACALSSQLDLTFLYKSLESLVDSWIVPAYTLAVLLYLSSLAFPKQLDPLYGFVREITSYRRPSVKAAPLAPAATAAIIPAGVEDDDQPFDMSGAYKLVENINYEEFLGVQGVPRYFRSMANKAKPVHRLTHRGSLLTIRIESLIESETTYIINGPPVQCDVRGRIFEDTMQYLENGKKGILVTKRALTEQYHVTVQRELSDDGKEILMTSKATFTDGKQPVECIQKFVRIIE